MIAFIQTYRYNLLTCLSGGENIWSVSSVLVRTALSEPYISSWNQNVSVFVCFHSYLISKTYVRALQINRWSRAHQITRLVFVLFEKIVYLLDTLVWSTLFAIKVNWDRRRRTYVFSILCFVFALFFSFAALLTWRASLPCTWVLRWISCNPPEQAPPFPVVTWWWWGY